MDPLLAGIVTTHCEFLASQRFELHAGSHGVARGLLCLTRDEAEFVDAIAGRVLPDIAEAIEAAHLVDRRLWEAMLHSRHDGGEDLASYRTGIARMQLHSLCLFGRRFQALVPTAQDDLLALLEEHAPLRRLLDGLVEDAVEAYLAARA